MFKKKTCKKCGEKISGKFNFCPYCGDYTSDQPSEDWGMLGKEDSIPAQTLSSNNLFGGISGKMLNKMLGSAMKMLEKEFKEEMRPNSNNFELYVNGKRISPENIKVTRGPLQKPVKEPVKKFQPNIFSKEALKKFSKLPKKEPETNVRRLSNKVIYEVNVPGVTSIKDILINKLENSIEIKAIGKDKAYRKLIPIDLPLQRYKLEGQKLVLELGVKG